MNEAHVFNTELFIDVVSSNFDYFDYHRAKAEYFKEWYNVIEDAWKKNRRRDIGDGIEHAFAYDLTLGGYKKMTIYFAFNLDGIMLTDLSNVRMFRVDGLDKDGFYLNDGGETVCPLLVAPLYPVGEQLIVVGGHGHFTSVSGDNLIEGVLLREKDLINQHLFGSEFERLVYACLCEVKQIASWRMRELTVNDDTILNKRFNKYGFYTFDCPVIEV